MSATHEGELWTPEEIEFVAYAMAEGVGPRETAEMLGRTTGGVSYRRWRILHNGLEAEMRLAAERVANHGPAYWSSRGETRGRTPEKQLAAPGWVLGPCDNCGAVGEVWRNARGHQFCQEHLTER